MPVTADQVATLRAYLAGDFEQYDRLYRQLDENAAQTGYMALIAAGFFEAIDRRFAKTSGTDAVEFVANLRSRSNELADAIDPRVAERLIEHSLGEGSIADLGDETVAGTQFLLLTGLVTDAQYDDAGLDEFLTTVRELADEWLS